MRARSCRLCLLIGIVGMVFAAGGHALQQSGSTPPERPRPRPPSNLTGWADWENAEELLRRIKVPPAPPLSPDEALKTFRLAPGYRIELVAAEPMVNSPIFFEFDPDGRIWVVEYPGYMRDLQGTGEADPICRIVVLEDTNGDGRADTSTVFLDGLVMPRSLAFVKGGVLVAEPPHLWFCQDTTGDLRCDRKVRVGTYGHAGNPQHTANGLRYGIDNWLHSADIPKRHRFVDERLIEEDTVHRGQFGVTFDDEGRFLTSRENRPLIADLIPAEYLLRNPNLFRAYQRRGSRQGAFGVNVNIAEQAQTVFPGRVTPAITLGALELREDGRLGTYTVVAGTGFYNGHQFPPDAYGNVFVPESGGHLVGRLTLAGDIDLRASRFYPDEQEFLTSTDERFRPVNSRVGPDGALYIADMYHGIIEHVIFMVPYIERQIRERRLDEGLDMGRIWRIVHDGNPIDRTPPRLSTASAADLVSHLSHPNGWWRLTAQRLLVERRDPAAVEPLRALARTGPDALGRLHALWTLQGMEALDWPLLVAAVQDPDDRVRAAAIRLGEHVGQAAPPDHVLAHLTRLAADPSPRVRLQAGLTAGAFQSSGTTALLLRLLRENEHPLFRAAVTTGLHGRELEALEAWLDNLSATPSEPHLETAGWLAELVMHEAEPARIEQLLDVAGQQRSTAVRHVLLRAMADAVPRQVRSPAPQIELRREPALLTELTRSDDEVLRQAAYRLHAMFTWPGAPALRPAIADVAPLTPEERRLAERGSETYTRTCAACHQPDGGGLVNVAPRLSGSDWVSGLPDRLIRIVLHGLYGPIEVDGEKWNLHMPGLGAALDDEEVAGVLTYVRRAWGNSSQAVRPAQVTTVRKQSGSRTLAWTVKELLAESSGPAAVDPQRVIRPGDDGGLELPARLAVTYGRELAYRPSLDVLAPWRQEHDVAEWHVDVPERGRYEVWVTLAADDASAGDRFVVATEDSTTTGVVLSSGGYETFREYLCGTLELAAGLNRVVMRPAGAPQRELADVRTLRLVRLRS
jgi:mono/diheme cytochrome c family protein/glucose/arabinose dehydrogenase/HEAT repeat protein